MANFICREPRTPHESNYPNYYLALEEAYGIKHPEVTDEMRARYAYEKKYGRGAGQDTAPYPKDISQNVEDYRWYKVPADVSPDVVVYNGTVIDGKEAIFASDEFGADGIGDIDAPTKKTFIYTTLPYPIYVMYPNNLIAPVAYDNSIANRYAGKTRNIKGSNTAQGIYVVEITSFAANKGYTDFYFPGLIDFYKNTNIVASENLEIQKDVIDIFTNRHRYDKSSRVVTYIPEYALKDHNVVYVPSLGLCFGSASILKNYVHPLSRESVYIKTHEIENVNNFISIDIIDNTTKNDYFLKIGKDILKLEPERNTTKPEGVVYKLHKNSEIVDKKFVSLFDAKEKLGVYNTRIECEHDGNVGKQIENAARRIELEDKKLDLEESKLVNARYISDNEREKEIVKKQTMEIELTKELAKHEFYKYKLKIGLEMLEAERTDKYLKYMADYTKYMMDVRKQEFDLIKHHYEINKMQFDAEKQEREIILSKMSQLDKIIKIIGSYF